MKGVFIVLSILIPVIFFGYVTFSGLDREDEYAGLTVIPEKRKDLPLYRGLVRTEFEYVIEGNHWKAIYDYYMKQLPKNGWELSHKQVFLEDTGYFTMTWSKHEEELEIHGGWNPDENKSSAVFDLRSKLHFSSWIKRIPEKACVYASPEAATCHEISDQRKREQLAQWVNNEAYDKKDAPLQKEYGIIMVDHLRIEVHYDPKLPSFTLKSKLGRKVMKPEKLLELTGLNHLKKR
jgi:hypothetical protein